MPRLRETLPSMSNQLDVCQRALSDFLEEKRAMFPRFYFIGDDDLLEILGQAKNPEVIQVRTHPSLPPCCENWVCFPKLAGKLEAC
jgi:hypothetical protein